MISYTTDGRAEKPKWKNVAALKMVKRKVSEGLRVRSVPRSYPKVTG